MVKASGMAPIGQQKLYPSRLRGSGEARRGKEKGKKRKVYFGKLMYVLEAKTSLHLYEHKSAAAGIAKGKLSLKCFVLLLI